MNDQNTPVSPSPEPSDDRPAKKPWIVGADEDSTLDRPEDSAHLTRDEIDPDHSDEVARWRRRSQRRRSGKKRPWWIELPILLGTAFLLTFLIQTFIVKVYYVPSGSMETTLHGVEKGGDRILVNKLVYDFRDPAPGDIVVFKGNSDWFPEVAYKAGATTWYGKIFEAVGSVVGIAPPDEKDFVKRVIATGGQTVECCDDQGRIMVDGIPIDEPYVHNPLSFAAGDRTNNCTVDPTGLTFSSKRCFGPITVPEGQLFLLGDHRSASADSVQRCWGKTEAGIMQNAQPGAEVGPCVRLVALDEVIGKAIFIIMPPSRWGTLGDPGIDVASAANSAMAPQTVPLVGGLLLTAGLRGGLALTPGRRRRRAARRRQRKDAARP